MPELPEVETVRRQLHVRLAHATIVEIVIWRTGRLRPVEGLDRMLTGRKIISVDRRAKLLIWQLDNGMALTAHLKMTGRFTFVDNNYIRQKHDRVRFVLRDARGKRFDLVWTDVRQFGYLALVSTEELQNIMASYGPEPLETSAAVLAERLHQPSRRTVKATLLNQTVIAGIGNIYADEACHRTGIRPMRRLDTLTSDERLRLAKNIQTVLRASVRQQGTSAQDYVDTQGKKGGFLSLLRVYGRDGIPCKTCKTTIKKTVSGQRGTHYCPSCQK